MRSNRKSSRQNQGSRLPQRGTPLVGPDDRRAQGLKMVIQIDDRRPLRRHDHCRYLGGLNTLCPQPLAT
jgi:hypothetical protein